VLGPSLGGLLSRPCAPDGLLAHAGACSRDDALLRRLPYFLPCVACAAFCAVAGVLAWVMPETMAPRAAKAAAAVVPTHAAQQGGAAKGGEYEPLSADAEEGDTAPLLPLRATGGDVEMLPLPGGSPRGPRGAPPPPPQPEPPDATLPDKRWFRNEQCVLTLLGYGMACCLHGCAFAFVGSVY
jgi:hypothetical protein